DAFGQGSVHAFHAGDLLDAGGLEPAESAEVAQQVGAAARADAGDVLQPAGVARLLAPTAMAGDGEPVRLVADLLHQLQCGRARTRAEDRKSTRLNSSHVKRSYAVFCLKKKKSRHRRGSEGAD